MTLTVINALTDIAVFTLANKVHVQLNRDVTNLTLTINV